MTTYRVEQHDPTSHHEDGSPVVLDRGGEYEGDLLHALAEQDARNLYQGEGKPQWSVVPEPTPEEYKANRPEISDVWDWLVDVHGVSEAEATRLVA